ncbi:hypothetical protein BDQ17DRAFT_202061 [Cyathus striatus]|nr:hypothetical protein BDQ17DRAFT_202061 [Cyathus striatus]
MENINEPINLSLSPPTQCLQCGSMIIARIASQPIPFSLLESGYFPNQSDHSTIQKFVSSTEETIRMLEGQLLHIRKFTAFQRSLLAPIRKLPEELLSEIFGRIVLEEDIDICSLRGNIWDIREVCSRWRNVVESTGALE